MELVIIVCNSLIVSIQLEMKSKCTIFYPQGTYYSYLSHAYTLYTVYMILVSYYVPMGVINEEVGKKVQTKRKCIYQGHLLYPPSKLCSLWNTLNGLLMLPKGDITQSILLTITSISVTCVFCVIVFWCIERLVISIDENLDFVLIFTSMGTKIHYFWLCVENWKSINISVSIDNNIDRLVDSSACLTNQLSER